MAETIQGGAYLSADGKTWHDAEGQPLSKEQVKEMEELVSKREAEVEEREAALQVAAPRAVYLASDAPAAAPKRATKGKGE